MNKLKIEHLSIRFTRYTNGINFRSASNLHPVKDLSIEAVEGELTVILGSSGSGKTLLANALTGILPQNAVVAGNIEHNGNPHTFETFFEHHKITFIPQSLSYLDPLMTIKKQALDIARLNGKSDREGMRAIEAYLQEYRLDRCVLSMYPHQLSGGMARRVIIILSLLNPAPILVADEPTPGLDEELIDEVWNFLRDNKTGRINLVITHDLRNALKYADKVYVFDDGRIVDTFEPQKQNYGEFTRRLIACMPENQFVDYFVEKNHD